MFGGFCRQHFGHFPPANIGAFFLQHDSDTKESEFSKFMIEYHGKIETECEKLSGAQVGSNHEKI